MLQANVQEELQSRGLSVTPAILGQLSRMDLDPAATMQAALACRSEEDFLRRIRDARQ